VGGLFVRVALNDMLWLLPVPLALIGFHALGDGFTDAAVVALLAAMALPMAAGIWMRAIVRRRIFLAGALQARSPWFRLLRGGAGLAVLAFAVAVLLSLLLLVAAVRAPGPHFQLALVLNLPVLVLLWHFWTRVFANHAVPRFRAVLALRAALTVNFLLLFPALGVGSLFQSYPDFDGLTLVQAMLSEAGRQQAESSLLTGLMQIAAAKDALVWWLGQQFLPAAAESGVVQAALRTAAWTLLLATDAAVVWSYLLLCSSVLTLVHWRAWHPGTGDP
jgi:hypothetical protein